MNASLRLALPCLLAAGCTGLSGPLIVVDADDPLLAAASESDEGVWQSAPFRGDPWLPFPARATVQIEHDLGREPAIVLVYLAFDAEGTDAALAAGELARVADIDDRFVLLRNDTNANFFARVVLE